ncbi:MAG: ABC transporter permease [Firmicutes bacterium]|nr:ABC transporter permease [Bacillota bacterium]
MNLKMRALLKNNAFQAIASSLLCIIGGLIIGFIVLVFINADGAWEGITDLVKNFFNYKNGTVALKYFGSTLVKTAPLLLCSLSILFCYKVGLFNIGAAGQYGLGAGIALYCALALDMPWWVCMILAAVAAGILGGLSGILKAYCNVNEVISGIMLNWISLYGVNILLTSVKETTSPYTMAVIGVNPDAIIPTIGLDKLFSNNQYVTLAVPLSIIIAIGIWVILEKTKFGYELKATGNNKNAAKYCGMAEKRNIIVTLVIGGALAGLGAAMFYLTGYEQWNCSASSVPAMGFNGISAAFLGGLNPIGSIFSSFFIQHITMGGAYLDKAFYCAQISDLISAIIIYLCGFVLFMKHLMNKGIAKSEEKEKRKNAEQVSAENTDKEGGK